MVRVDLDKGKDILIFDAKKICIVLASSPIANLPNTHDHVHRTHTLGDFEHRCYDPTFIGCMKSEGLISVSID